MFGWESSDKKSIVGRLDTQYPMRNQSSAGWILSIWAENDRRRVGYWVSEQKTIVGGLDTQYLSRKRLSAGWILSIWVENDCRQVGYSVSKEKTIVGGSDHPFLNSNKLFLKRLFWFFKKRIWNKFSLKNQRLNSDYLRVNSVIRKILNLKS